MRRNERKGRGIWEGKDWRKGEKIAEMRGGRKEKKRSPPSPNWLASQQYLGILLYTDYQMQRVVNFG